MMRSGVTGPGAVALPRIDIGSSYKQDFGSPLILYRQALASSGASGAIRLAFHFRAL